MMLIIMIRMAHSKEDNDGGAVFSIFRMISVQDDCDDYNDADEEDNDGICQGGGQILVNCYAGTSRQVIIKIMKISNKRRDR